MHRGPSTTQVVVICTSAVVRRMSCLWKVGSAPGPSDITTRFFAHLRRPIGTVVLISELSPVVANRTVPRGASGEPWLVPPSRLDAGWAEAARRATRPSATPTPIAVRRPPLLLTARVYERDRAQAGVVAGCAERLGRGARASSIHTSAPPPLALRAVAVPPWASAMA